MLPHLDAAYSLARWIVRDSHHAEDRVQEAYLRAFRYFHRFRGGDARPWLLQIVRNTCYSWLKASRLGFNMLEWSQAGMRFWAVSDISPTELAQFAGMQHRHQARNTVLAILTPTGK